MSKFQIPYEQAKRRMIMTKVPEIQKQIQELQVKMSQTTNPDEKKGLKAEIDALNIKIKSFRKRDPVREEVENEESQGAVTTGNVGSPTMTNSDGGTSPAAFGSSHIYAPSIGMFKRRGYTPPKGFSPKGKKKKKIREFVEYYFRENETFSIVYTDPATKIVKDTFNNKDEAIAKAKEIAINNYDDNDNFYYDYSVEDEKGNKVFKITGIQIRDEIECEK